MEYRFNGDIGVFGMQNSEDIKQKMRSVSYIDWKNMGGSKDTLHHMKKNAKEG